MPGEHGTLEVIPLICRSIGNPDAKMTNSISNIAASSSNNSKRTTQPASEPSNRVFTRTTQKPTSEKPGMADVTHDLAGASRPSNRSPASANADGVLNYRVFRGGYLVPATPQPVAQVRPHIPAPSQPDSNELRLLRQSAQHLMGAMRQSPSFQNGRGIQFLTHRGENGNASLGSDGALTISVNGRQINKFFNDAYDNQNMHVLMLGPDNRMHAGRNLPYDYLAEATRLANSALSSM